MKALKFDATKYGKSLLIDTASEQDFDYTVTQGQPNFYAIGLLKQGSGSIKIDDQHYQFGNYSILFIRPGARVKVEKMNLNEALWVFFEGNFLDDFFNEQFFTYKFNFFHGFGASHMLFMQADDLNEIFSLATQIRVEIKHLKPDSEHLIRAALYLMLIKLNRFYALQHQGLAQLVSDNKVLKLKVLLENQVNAQLQVADLALKLGISTTQLNQIATYYFGKTTKDLIDDRLAGKAKQHIAFSDLSISEIGFALGFTDAANFNRFFKRLCGITPMQYRKRFVN